jgi:uncharacterized protein YabE (DUF348 family)
MPRVTPETRPSRPYRRLGASQWRARLLVVFSLAVILIVALAAIYTLTQKTVTIKIGGEVWRFRTHADTVQEALNDAHIWIDPEDEIDPPLSARLSGRQMIIVRKARVIAVEADGTLRQIRTQAVHPLEVLTEQGVSVGQYDIIQVDGQTYSLDHLGRLPWVAPATTIRVLRSATVRVTDQNRVLLVYTTQTDVGRALDSLGLALYLADRVTPDLSTPVSNGLAVVVERSMPITITVDGQQWATRALGPTVGDALAVLGIAPADLDYTLPPEDTSLAPDMMIRVVRVTEDWIIETAPIPFETLRQPDRRLVPGEERIAQEGADGIREQRIRVRYEDGQAISRTVQSERVSQPPTPQIIAYGPPTEPDNQ